VTHRHLHRLHPRRRRLLHLATGVALLWISRPARALTATLHRPIHTARDAVLQGYNPFAVALDAHTRRAFILTTADRAEHPSDPQSPGIRPGLVNVGKREKASCSAPAPVCLPN